MQEDKLKEFMFGNLIKHEKFQKLDQDKKQKLERVISTHKDAILE